MDNPDLSVESAGAGTPAPVYSIPMRCVPKERPRRVTKNGKTWTYMNTSYVTWKKDFAASLRAQAPILLAGNLSLTATISIPDNRRGDLDNMIGSILDAAQGILFTNDKQFTELHLRFRKGPPLIILELQCVT